MTATRRPPSERVLVAGQTESGKTHFLERYFLSVGKAPRALIVDRTGEWARKELQGVHASGLRDTVRALDEYSTKRNWRIVTTLSNEEMEELSKALLGGHEIAQGYCYNVGGMALVLSEIDLLVPVTNAPEHLRSLWRRGSHAGLSILADTQRPANVSKETTSQCRWLAFFALYEPGDLEYVRKQLGKLIAPQAIEWIQEKPYQCALFDQKTRLCHLITKEGRVRQALSERLMARPELPDLAEEE